jgi:hypothetical protein
VIRRSATGAVFVPFVDGGDAISFAVSSAPHAEQNLPEASAPQPGQVRANAVPHSEQNRAVGDVATPHE